MSNEFAFESIYSVQGVLLVPFVSVGLTLLFLGFYILLFGMVIYFMRTRSNMANSKFHLGCMITLFILSVSSALLGASIVLREAVLGFHAASTKDIEPLMDWEMPNNTLHLVLDAFHGISYVLANTIADGILLYRCFLIWESKKQIFIIPFLICLCTNVMGFIGHVVFYAAAGAYQYELAMSANTVDEVFLIANAANTTLLTLMIAGRIWWRTRNARTYLDQATERTYKRIILVLIESGFIYSASLITNVVIIHSASSLGYGLGLNSVIALMVGIAPTLIMLRTSLGWAESAVHESRMVTALQFEPSRVSASATNSDQTSGVRSLDLERGSSIALVTKSGHSNSIFAKAIRI
ncbi:hypothetical protein Moror_4855 [Moniliophthora roreri MCA 2997]|uniref:Uncharacterized protein n=1 Tax=Moniliophthora roreri (strain MCA 2997) TaxID=1381753 RepID=V2XVT8_MONRO|nr:hypothetical protein Moror_4855 [Moniliophthora roreri MCA 2997]